MYTKTMPKFTMTQEVYFHTPKCTFDLDPIWHKKWNYKPLLPNSSGTSKLFSIQQLILNPSQPLTKQDPINPKL